jgi:actin-related protein
MIYLMYFYLSRLAEIMFESFHTSALFMSKDAVLSCYAAGRTTGLVVDMGKCCFILLYCLV